MGYKGTPGFEGHTFMIAPYVEIYKEALDWYKKQASEDPQKRTTRDVGYYPDEDEDEDE